jgi:hypothetical protein
MNITPPLVLPRRIIERKKWQESNELLDSTAYAKTLFNAAANRRYRLIKELPNTLTDAQWQFALSHFDHRCAVCGMSINLFVTLAADHWIPVSSPFCPGTIATNIIPLCHTKRGGIGGCNNSKGDSDPTEWLTAKFGGLKAKKIEKRIGLYFSLIIKGVRNGR